jgi:hypothetical protein
LAQSETLLIRIWDYSALNPPPSLKEQRGRGLQSHVPPPSTRKERGVMSAQGNRLAVQSFGLKRGSRDGGAPPGDLVVDPLTVLHTAELRDLIERLNRIVEDLNTRKERRAKTLDTPRGAPQSDPLYQRLFFAQARFSRQVERVQGQLSQRSYS